MLIERCGFEQQYFHEYDTERDLLEWSVIARLNMHYGCGVWYLVHAHLSLRMELARSLPLQELKRLAIVSDSQAELTTKLQVQYALTSIPHLRMTSSSVLPSFSHPPPLPPK